jgi:hypothetical protein
MKKIFTLTCFVCVLLGADRLYAQLSVHATETYIAGPTDALMTAHATVTNNGSSATWVFVARISQVLAPGHVSYFCWNQCYDPIIDVSPDSTLIGAGQAVSIFNGDLNPLGYAGTSYVTYVFFDRAGDSTTAVTYTYEATPTGINEPAAKTNLNTASPNPANGFTRISYNVPAAKDARIVICNMLGSVMKEIKLSDSQNTLTLSTSDLKQGVYFYSLVVDGRTISSKKLIVTHN